VRWAFVALIPVLVHAVLMTYSRGAMVSLLAACPLLLMRSRHRVVLGLFGALFLAVVLPAMAGPQIRARFMTLERHESDETANSRRATWAAGWKMARDNPIFGVGVRNANLFSYEYGADVRGQTIHSQYFQVAADNGFVGLALYLAVLITAWTSLRRCRRAGAGRTDADARRLRALASGIECSMLVYAVGAVFLSLEVFELPYLLLLLAAQLGLLSRGPGAVGLWPAGAPQPGALAPAGPVPW
jgi:probable O-glycosylation ligase (exosortase A-associated)